MNRLGLVGIAILSTALFVACGDDDSPDAAVTGTPDAKVNTVDGATSNVDAAGPTPDAGPASFTVALTKAGEPTPAGGCTNAGASAVGSATVTVSADNSTISVAVTWSGLSGDATMGHIHFGSATDTSGPVVIPFMNVNATPGSFSHDFHAGDYINGGTGTPTAPTAFADFVADVRQGNKAYVNIHTTACAGGEIRGEIGGTP